MKINKYTILTRSYSLELSKIVEKYIDDDWQPLGGVLVYSHGAHGASNTEFCQAMVKYEDDD